MENTLSRGSGGNETARRGHWGGFKDSAELALERRGGLRGMCPQEREMTGFGSGGEEEESWMVATFSA